MVIHFINLAENWFNTKKKLLKPSSASAYYTIVYSSLIPYFSAREINNLTVQQYVIEKTKSGLSKRTITDHIKILGYILKEANVPQVFDIEYPTSLELRKRESKAFSVADIKKLRSYIVEHSIDDIYNFAVLIGLSLGLRIGEITALKFSDFDLNTKMVYISRTAQRIAIFDENNKIIRTEINIGTTKTKSSTRKLPVPEIILEMVKKYNVNKSPDDYIFMGKFSKTIMDNRLLRENYYKLLCKLDLPKITFHGLRHSFASNCIASKIDVKTTSSMLGHSDIKMTLEIYTHPSFEQKKQAVNRLGKLFS